MGIPTHTQQSKASIKGVFAGGGHLDHQGTSHRLFSEAGHELTPASLQSILVNDRVLVVSSGEPFVGFVQAGSSTEDEVKPADLSDLHDNITVLCSSVFVEEAAVNQLNAVAKLKGVVRAFGMPDLHPGRGTPIGASIVTEAMIYPHLVGSDVGCGMALFQTGLAAKKVKLDKWVSRMKEDGGIDSGLGDVDADAHLRAHGFTPRHPPHDGRCLGTIGGGNHFAELCCIDGAFDRERLDAGGIDPRQILLLVHSGSRSLGQSILQSHSDAHGTNSLASDSEEYTAYMHSHNAAVGWAQVNRQVIAWRLCERLGTAGLRVLDITHNSVVESASSYIHRKGAAPADVPLVVIPGSRGSFSYLVAPTPQCSLESCGLSLAHGAGRKWARGKAGKMSTPKGQPDLRSTQMGSRVICEDATLLREEQPRAYKNVDEVVGDLVDLGLCVKVARLRPLITYKTC